MRETLQVLTDRDFLICSTGVQQPTPSSYPMLHGTSLDGTTRKLGAFYLLVSPSSSSEFPIYVINPNRHRYTSLILFALSLPASLSAPRSAERDRGYPWIGISPSWRVFCSKSRAEFFSHWKLRHLCRFRDYFCWSVLSMWHPVGKKDGRKNRASGSEREEPPPEEPAQPTQWETALLAFQNGIYRK